MQKKMFLVLSGLLLLVSFSTAQTFGETAIYDPAPGAPYGGWSAPVYHPEIGDKIVTVNGVRVRSEGDFSREVRNSSSTIILGVVDQRSGQYYHLRTNLWSPNSSTRLGIYARTSGIGDGVVVTGFVSNAPGMRCQYLRDEIAPVRDGLSNGGWYINDSWYNRGCVFFY